MLENCCALREKKDLIDETKDPLTAIAEKYMKIPCAVMTPNPVRTDCKDLAVGHSEVPRLLYCNEYSIIC